MLEVFICRQPLFSVRVNLLEMRPVRNRLLFMDAGIHPVLSRFTGDNHPLANSLTTLSAPERGSPREEVGFVHPRTKEYKEFDSKLPEDIKSVLILLRR